MNRYFYIVALHNNSNAVAPDSSYRLASGQVAAYTMDLAFNVACLKEGVTRERNPLWTMRVVYDHYVKDRRVSVYISPLADDITTN